MLISDKWMFKTEFRPTKKDPAAVEWRTGPDHKSDVSRMWIGYKGSYVEATAALSMVPFYTRKGRSPYIS